MVDRPRKPVAFGRLRQVLLELGYQSRSIDAHYVAFVRPGRDLFVVVPDAPPEAEVRPIDLWSVEKTLINDGLIANSQEFAALFLIKKGDRLIWTDPHTGRETEVVTASGETSDGMVLVKSEGAGLSALRSTS